MPPLTCDRCGATLPEDARFCSRCGAPVAAMVTEERKVVTILFADLARSTELAAQLDPERFREVMADFFRMVSTELESLRGRAEKFVGDAVMAVFGLPHAHDDDALRAVRAGLVIRDRTARLGEELALPMPLQVRVGINSGAVATGSGPADQLLVSGAPVNLAARLQEAARPGEVLVGETTWQLTRRQVAFGRSRKVTAKGFDVEVVARPVTGLSTRSVRRTIPLVDRRRELALLTETFERVRETGRAHMFTLLGETGIGKSRLAEELVAGLPEEAGALVGRANAFEEDVTFAPLADMIRRLLGVERDAPASLVKQRLTEVVERCCDPSEIEQTAGRLGLAVGLGEEPPSREGRSYRAAEIRAGVLTLLQGLARKGPVLMVFEDLHVGRPGLLDLIEQVVVEGRRIPVMVLAIARDYLLEERPAWGAGLTDAFRLRLEPLSLEESRELARVAGESLDDAMATRIAERAGGNPFFIVETTGMLLQRHEAHIEGAPHSHLLPPTVQAVVASRIDHLPEQARDLFRKASVFPRSTFHVTELALIADPKPPILRTLEEAELLLPDRERPGMWRFRHSMLRDVAYESLPKRERLRLHLVVADALDKEDGDRHPGSIAYHLEQAARASLDLAPGDRDIAERAVRALQKAGDRARRAMESATAADLYERALALAGQEEDWGKQEARILAGLGETRYWLGLFGEAEWALTRALDVGAGDDWSETHASRFLADILLNIRRETERAEAYFERAVAAARRLDDPWAMARTLLMAGWAPFWRNDLDESRALFEEALAIARNNPERDRWAEARALTSLSSVISPVGDEAECLELAEKALALGKEMGDRFTIAVAQMYAGNSLRRMMRLEEAFPRVDDAVQVFRNLGAKWELASALGDRGTIHRLSGRHDDAIRDLKEAVRLARELGDRSVLTWSVAEMARTYLSDGDLVAVRRTLEELPEGTDRDDSSLQAARVVADLAAGDRDRAQALAVAIVEGDRTGGRGNYVATRTWWAARLFGDDAVGGPAVAEEARRTLEEAHWIQFIREPDLALPERLPA